MPGAELAFPSLQTYSSGEVVDWIGPPDSDEPAPRVTLSPSAGEAEPAPEEPAEEVPEAAPAAEAAADTGGGEARANLALGFGVAGLIGIAVALLRRQ